MSLRYSVTATITCDVCGKVETFEEEGAEVGSPIDPLRFTPHGWRVHWWSLEDGDAFAATLYACADHSGFNHPRDHGWVDLRKKLLTDTPPVCTI